MATIEQLKKAIFDRESQIGNLQKQISDLKQQIKDQAEFKVGDFVRVGRKSGFSGEWVYHNVFVSDIEFSYDYRPIYRFNKVKKDGTMSGQSASLYGYDSIELLNSDQNDQRSVATKAS